MKPHTESNMTPDIQALIERLKSVRSVGILFGRQPTETETLCHEAADALEQFQWRDISSAPRDGTPIEFANFDARCLLTGAPHIWSGRYMEVKDSEIMMLECSYAATNDNGEPTHFRYLPPPPKRGEP